MDQQNRQKELLLIIEKAVTVFVLGFGLHYVGYPIRVKYRDFLDTLTIGEGLYHVLGYLGHIAIYAVMFLYAWAVRKRQKIYLFFHQRKAKAQFHFCLACRCAVLRSSNSDRKIYP